MLGLPGDENTLLTLASPVFTTPIVQGTPSVIDQITPIAGFIQTELMLLTTPTSEWNGLQDMVAAAKATPGPCASRAVRQAETTMWRRA